MLRALERESDKDMPKYIRIRPEYCPKFDQDTLQNKANNKAKILPNYGQDTVNLQLRYGQYATKIRLSYGLNKSRYGQDTTKKLAEIRPR